MPGNLRRSLMISRSTVAVMCVVLLGAAGVADGKAAKAAKPKKPSRISIDGTWHAQGTVTVAKHISDAAVGQKFTRTWTIKSTCSSLCKTTLSYGTSKGHQISVPLHGKGKSWKGVVDKQVFSCTNGGTAIGSIAFKLRVTGVTTKKHRHVATAMTGTGTQQGTGCATVKLVATFAVHRA
jgi:hypothetical protein